MKKLAIIFLSASLLASSAFAEEDRVVATYKGGEVRESQVMKQFKPALDMQPSSKDKNFSQLDANLQNALVNGYINIKLLEQETKSQNVESSKEFQDKLNTVKTQMLQQEVVERHVKSVVTDQLIDAEYDKIAASLKGKEEVKVSHILVGTEAEAIELKKKLNKGAKFANLAKDHSKDEGSKANGGEIGYVIQGQLVPEFENKALSMKVNEISAPVKTQFGWHIIKVLDKRPAKIPSKEEARANISARLSREAMEKYLADLASKAEVKLNLPTKDAAAIPAQETKTPAESKPTK